MKTQAIIPAAGSGVRFGSKQPKPLVRLKGKPMIAYSLEILLNCKSVDSVILVVGDGFESEFEKVTKTLKTAKKIRIVKGGATRCESVASGLKALDKDTDIVLIHDGARPLISEKLIEEAIRCEQIKTTAA